MIYMLLGLIWVVCMDMIKKHVDTVIVLGGILSSVIWMNGRLATIEKDLAVIKTVLIMKDLMPKELASDKPKQQTLGVSPAASSSQDEIPPTHLSFSQQVP